MESDIQTYWASHRLIGDSKVIVPTVRMVVILAQQWKDENGAPQTEHSICPVLALWQRRETIYTKGLTGGSDAKALIITERDKTYRNHKELIEAGYYVGSQDTLVGALFNHPQYELIYHDDEIFRGLPLQERQKVCVCLWPPEKDEEKLATEIESLKKDLCT